MILRSRGVYKQAKVYQRGGYLYAGFGSGFIRLMKHGTSAPHVGVDQLVLSHDPHFDRLGYLLATHKEARNQ